MQFHTPATESLVTGVAPIVTDSVGSQAKPFRQHGRRQDLWDQLG